MKTVESVFLVQEEMPTSAKFPLAADTFFILKNPSTSASSVKSTVKVITHQIKLLCQLGELHTAIGFCHKKTVFYFHITCTCYPEGFSVGHKLFNLRCLIRQAPNKDLLLVFDGLEIRLVCTQTSANCRKIVIKQILLIKS